MSVGYDGRVRRYRGKDRKAPAKQKPAIQKRARFIASYLKTGNATQAALDAGYSPKGSRRTARTQGAYLLAEPDVARAIAQKQAKALAKVEATAERTLAEVAQVAYQPAHIIGRDKVKALDLLMRHFKLLTNIFEVRDADELEAALVRGRERARARIEGVDRD